MIPQFKQKKITVACIFQNKFNLILVALTFISINNKIAINKT